MTEIEIKTWKDFKKWAKAHFTRKFTVPIHIAAGIFCGILYYWYPGLAIFLFVSFGLFELWQHRAEQDHGYLDLLDGIIGKFTGAISLLILTITGVLV